MTQILSVLSVMLCLIMPIESALAQAKILEPCEGSVKCDSGLTCVKLRNGKSVCSACSQSDSDSLTQGVDEACKTFGSGWTPGGNQMYQDATASDGRVANTVFDQMFEQAKNCRERRTYRERTCWGGGDSDHKAKIEEITRSQEGITGHRDNQFRAQRLFFTDKSTYENRFRTYRDNCEAMNQNNMNQTLDVARVAVGRSDKADCSALDKIKDDTLRCFQAVKSFREDAFQNNSDRFPDAFKKVAASSDALFDRSVSQLKETKDKNLCK